MSAHMVTCPACTWERWAPGIKAATKIRREHDKTHPDPTEESKR